MDNFKIECAATDLIVNESVHLSAIAILQRMSHLSLDRDCSISECVPGRQYFTDFFLDTIDLADEAFDCLVDLLIRGDNLLEDFQVHVVSSRRVVVVGLDELHLGGVGSEQLLDVTMSFLFHLFDLLVLGDFLFKCVDIGLLCFDLLLELCKDGVLVLVGLLVELDVLFKSLEALLNLDLVTQQVVIVLFFSSELVVVVLILGLSHLFIGQKLLDLCRFLTIELVLQAFVGDVLLSFELNLELLVFGICELFGLCKFFALRVKLLGHLCEDLDLNIEELNLDFGLFDFLSQISCLSKSILVVFHSKEVFFDLLGVSDQLLKLLLLSVLQASDKFDLKIVPV